MIHFAIHQGLILSFNVIGMTNITGVKMLFNYKSEETVVWCVSCTTQNSTDLTP